MSEQVSLALVDTIEKQRAGLREVADAARANGFQQGLAAAISEIVKLAKERESTGDTHAVLVCALLAERIGERRMA